MTAVAGPRWADGEAPQAEASVGRATGIELLGPVAGSGYRDGAALVRRGDGQMVQLGPLMYSLLESADSRRTPAELAAEVSMRLGRRVGEDQILRLVDKLAQQGLLAGTEHRAPPKRNPLLALRWKVLVTNPAVTRRLTAPFTFLFRPWIMWPLTLAFAAVCWFVVVQKGVASATAQAFHSPGLLLLVFGLGVLSAGFHELGHASACLYGGATPGGMGMGLYLVWPAFYTDVTDAYRLPRRDRLRIDLAGLYFNAVVADLTMVAWLFWRVDALLLLVALQILQMVKQLSPIIRADGYHILSDATGVPDLYAHMGPTLRRLIPGRPREASALTGRARLLVSAWVLTMVPILLSLMLGAVLLMPRLAATAWDNGRRIAELMPHQAAAMHLIDLGASVLQLVALILPVAGSVLVTQKVIRSSAAKARAWSAGRPLRAVGVMLIGAAAVALLAWAWWPAGQYKPVRAHDRGTLPGLVRLVTSSSRSPATAAPVSPGTHLAVAMIPVGGPSRTHPAVFLIAGVKGHAPTAILNYGGRSRLVDATAFPFELPAPPGPNGTQAVAVNATDGGVTYSVAYALVTVSGGRPVDQTSSAFAIAHCRNCTTVAVSFQVVLVVGQSKDVAPIDAAGALNYECPACTTTALADQMVVTLTAQPSQAVLGQLQAALAKLNALPLLGANGTPQAVATEVASVQEQVQSVLQTSGLLAQPSTPTTTTPVSTTSTTTSSMSTTATTTYTQSSGTTADTATTSTAGDTSTSSTSTSTSTSTSVASTTTTAPPATTTTTTTPSTTSTTSTP